jgi:hypothetical protein
VKPQIRKLSIMECKRSGPPFKTNKIIKYHCLRACFRNSDEEIEVEYQSDTIGKYDLDFNGKTLH